jgi:cytochrome o ubiquinol oxidase subunit 2
VALDWTWLFIYPAQGVATVNQLAVPASRPVHLTLASATVMQSERNEGLAQWMT